jgi:D-3-phosphoglycerate dehydrogenase
MTYRVLLLDGIESICKTILESRGIEAVEAPKLAGAELFEAIKDYDGLVVRSQTKVTLDLLKAAPKLQVVGRAGVGVDNIDLEAATKMGVLVMNTPDGNTISTAEHTCGLIMALARNIPNAVKSLKDGAWDRKKYTGTELDGKVLGVVGLGKIGSGVATRMLSFGMTVIAYDPFTSAERAAELGVELADLDTVLAKADFLTVHTPLTDKTRGMVSKATASKLKKGVRLVNVARGGIFAEADLLDLLNDGTIGGLAVDVYSIEPTPAELLPLLQHPKVVCTPHLGASTDEAQEKVAEQIAAQIADTLERKSFKGTLNGKSIALSTNREVQPFLKLAERLGSFASQLAAANNDILHIEYSGNCASHAEVLTDAVLKGYLKHSSDETINLINARYNANQKGLKVTETISHEVKTYADKIRIQLNKKGHYDDFSATLFGENDFRIVKIDGHDIEILLDGGMMLYKNIDKPGMLAAVSSTLAKREINIAALSLGRTGTQAVTAVMVDSVLSNDVLNEVDALPGVDEVVFVQISA